MADTNNTEKLKHEVEFYANLFNEFFDVYANMCGFDNGVDYLVDLGVTDEEFEMMGFDKEDVARARERADKE